MFELVGLEVVEEGGRVLGSVVRVEPGVANDALALDGGLMLPLVGECVRDIDLEAQTYPCGARLLRPRLRLLCSSTSSPSFRMPTPGSPNNALSRPCSGRSSTCVSTRIATTRRSVPARSTTSRTAAEPEWSCESMSSPQPSTRSTAGVPGHRVVALTPQGRQLTQEVVEELAHGGARHAALVAVRRLRRADRRAPLQRLDLDRAVRALERRPAGDGARRLDRAPSARARWPRARASSSRSLPALGGGREHPHYTRPAEFRGWGVPEVLLSGDHGKVEAWRREHVR